MTNSLAQQKEDTCSSSSSGPLLVDAVAGDVSTDPETRQDNEALPDIPSGLSNLVNPETLATTLELDSDFASDEGTCPAASRVYTSTVSASKRSDSADCLPEDCGLSKGTIPGPDTVHDMEKRNCAMEVSVDSSNDAMPVHLSASNDTSCASHEEYRDDVPELCTSTGNSALVDTSGSRLSLTRISSDPIDENTEDIARKNVSVSRCQNESFSKELSIASENLGGNVGMVSLADSPIAPMKPDAPAAYGQGDLGRTVQVDTESIQIIPEAIGASSSHAMDSDDENVKVCQKDSREVVFRDLEAGPSPEIISSVDEGEMHGVDLAEDRKCSRPLEAMKEAVSVEAFDHDAAYLDNMKGLVDSELREPLLEHVQTDDIKSSQDKEVSPGGENKLGGDNLEKEAEVHGLRRRRTAKADTIKPSAGGDSGLGKMPEEPKKVVTTTRIKDPSTDVGQEAKQKPGDKKPAKQGKSAAKPLAVKKSGDSQPVEESQPRAKEEAETNRKMHESLDNFIRQTIRCEPYMNFTSRPGDKPLQRLRPDVFENHVAGKFARGFKVDNGSDPRDIVTEDNRGMDSNSSDVDVLKDGSTVAAKGLTGLGRGAQHSLKAPPGVVTFTQAPSKGTDLQGWLSVSKTKCEKCSREFFSTLNYRRHVRMHRRSFKSEQEDLSKERSKVAAFWDKLTPEEAGNIVHYEKMESEQDFPRQAALDGLRAFINQLGQPSLPQGILKAGSSLLCKDFEFDDQFTLSMLKDIVQNKSAAHLPSERLLAILDEASEKTFLCGGTSVVVQRYVFDGEAGKVGLEEKNLVASMGFHIELRLVKAWMADKDAEALRCQQEMIKEEEAAEQKRKKLLEKKRLKKIRQKERKGSTSQLMLQELENDSIDEEGNIQGIGEEDDSPTGTGSSSSSLASAQDLALPESAQLDETDALGHADIDEHELAFGEKSDTGKTVSSDDDQVHRFPHGLSQYGRERPQRGEIGSPYRKEEPSARESVSEVGADFQPRPADQVDWDGESDSRSAYLFSQSKSARAGEVQSGLSYRKGEQDRTGSDFKRREYERTQERRNLRNARDRVRNDHLEQKPTRDLRGFDARYGDGHPTAFKPLRKPNPYFVKGDSGNADLSNTSRLHQHRKPPGLNRASIGGNGQVVWTKKVPQPAAVEATKDSKEEETVRDDAESSTVDDGWAASEAFPEVPLGVNDFAGGDVAITPDSERMENEEDAASQVPLNVSTGIVITLTTSSCASVSLHVDANSEGWPPLTQRFRSNSSCSTSLLTKSANFDSSPSIVTEKRIASVSQLSEGDSGSVVGSCSDGSFGLTRTTLASVRLQDTRLAGPSDHVISAEEIPEVHEDLRDPILVGPIDDVISAEEIPEVHESLRDPILVGSNIVFLPKFPSVSMSQARSGSNAPYLHHPSDTEADNLSRAGSLDGSHGLPGVVLSGQEVPLSDIRTAPGSSDGSEPLEKSLGSPLRASGSRSNPNTTQPAKSKPQHSSSSPERGESSRHSAPPLGNERVGVKQGSWQASGRFVSAKVWRAVGMVGERQDSIAPLAHAGSGDSSSSLIEARLSQDVDSSGRSEGERETSPKAAVRQDSLTKEDEFLRGDSEEGRDLNDDRPGVMTFDTSNTGDKQSKLSSSSLPFRPVRFESGLLSEGKADDHTGKAQIDNGVESSTSPSGLCSWSGFAGVAGTFFNERWRAAVANASNDEVFNTITDSISNEAEGSNFMDTVLRQLSIGSGPIPSADSGSSPSSSVVAEIARTPPTQDAGAQLSRIFSDSDQTGVEDIRYPSTIDEQALDGASPQAPSSEDDAGLRDASTSPVGSEHDMSGSEMASSAPVARGSNFTESGGGGGVGFSYTRRGNSRQERWHRYSRDRFPEQRYMARRRAPVEKISRV